jgi:hypothetical protein
VVARGRKRSDKFPDCGLVLGPRKFLGYRRSTSKKKTTLKFDFFLYFFYKEIEVFTLKLD